MLLEKIRRSLDSFGWNIFYSALLHMALAALAIHLSALSSATPVRVSIAPSLLSVGFTDAGIGFSSSSPSIRPAASHSVIGAEEGRALGLNAAGLPEAAASGEGSAAGFAEGALVDSHSGWGNRPPIYPTLARQNGWEGDVLLRVNVSAQGMAQTVEVIQSSGYPILDDAAADAVARWRFIPAKQRGKPVPSLVEIPIRFRLRDKDG